MTGHPPTTSETHALNRGGTLALTDEHGQVAVSIGEGGATRRIMLQPAGMARVAQHLAQVMAGPAHVPRPPADLVVSGQDLAAGCALRLSGTRVAGLTIAITQLDGAESVAGLTDAEAQWLAVRSMLVTFEARWKSSP